MLALLLLSVVCIMYVVHVCQKLNKRYKAMDLPPMYPGKLPLIGHAHLLMGNTTKLWTLVKKVTDVCLKHDGVLCAFIGTQVYYIIADPEDSLTAANTCLTKHFAYDFGKPWMGEGLVLSSGAIWRRHRKLISPAFSLQVLHGFLGVFNSQARKLVTRLSIEGRGTFNHLTALKDIALETVCLTAFGITADEDYEFNVTYMKAVDQILNLIALRFQNVWLQSNLIYNFSELKKKEDSIIKVLNAMSNTVIKRKKEAMKNKTSTNEPPKTGIKCKAFMDLLLELSDENAMSDKEIREEVDTAIVAAYDTTSCILAYALMLLGTYPEKQDMMYQELQEVFEGSDRDVTKDDLPRLVYTEAVIKETLRLYPAGPVGLRYVDKDVKLKNYTMRAGSHCAILNYGIHQHPMWGADVKEFKPERWLSADTLPSGPNIFAGFAIGKRACMGRTFATLSMKTTLAHVIRKYKIKADISKLVLKIDFLLKPVSGHEISIEERV